VKITWAMLALLPLPAHAGFQVADLRYACDRGVTVQASYINDSQNSAAVIVVEGRQVTLMAGPTGSGARYVQSTDDSHYIWWTKGADATLYWRDSTTNADTVVLDGCKEM
jgi:membrane-bound inhibitor of C-type lysozyme